MDLNTSRLATRIDPEMVIKAWKDPDFADRLAPGQRGQVPANPAGTMHLDTVRLASFGGPERTVGCNSVSSDCNTVSSNCNTVSSSCNTVSSSCNTVSSDCNTVSSNCNTVSSSCNTVSGDCTASVSCRRASMA